MYRRIANLQERLVGQSVAMPGGSLPDLATRATTCLERFVVHHIGRLVCGDEGLVDCIANVVVVAYHDLHIVQYASCTGTVGC